MACQFVHVECLVRLSAARHIPSGVIAIHGISYDGLRPRLICPTGLDAIAQVIRETGWPKAIDRAGGGIR